MYDELAAFMSQGRVVILSGAGLSTESGIPDYRGATGIAARGGPVEVVRGTARDLTTVSPTLPLTNVRSSMDAPLTPWIKRTSQPHSGVRSR